MVAYYFISMKKIKLKNNFNYKKLKEKYALLNNQTGKYLFLNESAIVILEIAKSNEDFNDILVEFTKYFGIKKTQAEQDLNSFLKMAKDLQILEINDVA